MNTYSVHMRRVNIFFFIRNTNLTHIHRECARSFSTEYVVIVMYRAGDILYEQGSFIIYASVNIERESHRPKSNTSKRKVITKKYKSL